MDIQLNQHTGPALKLEEKKLRDKGLFITGHISKIGCLELSKDNRYILSTSGSCFQYADYSIKVWDILTQKQIESIEDDQHLKKCITISFDNKYIVSASQYLLQVYNFNEK